MTAQSPRPIPSDEVTAARRAAEVWLVLTDTGRPEESWDSAAELFRRGVTRRYWLRALSKYRSPLGALRSRTFTRATASTTLLGAPDGEYLVVEFETVFAHRPRALEVVTMVKEGDGEWRVAGHNVQ